MYFCSNCMRSVQAMVRTNVPQLTERQRDCLQGFLERKTAKEIGRELGIGHHGVEQHLKAARKKLERKAPQKLQGSISAAAILLASRTMRRRSCPPKRPVVYVSQIARQEGFCFGTLRLTGHEWF